MISSRPLIRTVAAALWPAAIAAAVSGLAVASLAAGQATLFDAVRSGDREAIRAVLHDHPDVNAREPDGTTALHWAVRGNDLETVRLLLRAGARVNVTNRYDLTPLALAAANGEPAMLNELLRAGADVNATTPAGETVLMTASRTGNPQVVQLLLDRGADVSAREQTFSENALMWAAAENHPEVVRLLAEHGADLNAPASLLHFPNIKVDAATMVITALPRGGLTPLMYAARQGSLGAARALADLGASLNATDPDGMSALAIAIINAHYDVAAMLSEKGADPNVADVVGMAGCTRRSTCIVGSSDQSSPAGGEYLLRSRGFGGDAADASRESECGAQSAAAGAPAQLRRPGAGSRRDAPDEGCEERGRRDDGGAARARCRDKPRDVARNDGAALRGHAGPAEVGA